MEGYTPFSPVEIIFANRKEAVEYVEHAVSLEGKTLILASEGRIAESGIKEKLLCDNQGRVIHISKVPANPSISDIYDNLIKLRGANIERIVAMGGGSCIDLAKSISALHYFIPDELLSILSVRNAIKNKEYLNNQRFIDIIAIPTTSGTGSEVTKWATIWDMEQKEKLSVDCADIFPKVALLVPEFTVTMPPRLTLSTGLDALSHAMEAFWAKSRTPLSQALAIMAIENIKNNLPKVLYNGSDKEGRKEMVLASLIAGLAFSITRTTACHSISYPLTMYYGVEHGFAAAITLAKVADSNKKIVKDITKVYSVFGGKPTFARWMKEVTSPFQELRLSAFGIGLGDIDFIAEKTFTQGRMDNNPIIFTHREIKDILTQLL